jgi:two-component system cell cycle sensor histidine kinase/response regulator CckA
MGSAACQVAIASGEIPAALLGSLLDQVSDLVLCLRADGSLAYVNQPFLTALGYSTDELENLNFADLVQAADRSRAAQAIQRARSGENVLAQRLALRTKTGQSLNALASLSAAADNGGPACVRVLCRPLVEPAAPMLHGAAQGATGDERFRLLIEASPDAIFIYRDNGLAYVNPAGLALLGASAPADLLGTSPFDIIHPENHTRARARMRQAFERGDVLPMIEQKLVRRDGSEVEVEIAAATFADPEGPAVLLIARDITERKFAEERRWQLKARIRHAQKLESLGLLAGGIAHDFNNLLTSMLGYANLARMELEPECAAASMLAEIEKAAQRAAELSQQMLAYSGKGKFVLRVMRLDNLVREMARLLETAVSKNATLHLDLQPAALEGDPTQIRQIVMNLITNASDALEGRNGTITLRTSIRHMTAEELRSPFRRDDLPAGDYACVEVEDTGCGMGEETIGCIFDPFFTTKFTGRGLGLAAVLGIVRGHRGAIKVISTPGEGSMFQVFFPAAVQMAEEPPPAPAKPSFRWTGHGAALLVDDEAGVRSFASRVLQSAGLTVHAAVDGVDGLELFQQLGDHLNVVLLDLTMPRMDGLEVLRRITEAGATVPVILMSGYSEQEAAARAAGLNVRSFLQQPFQPDELLRHVAQALTPTAAAP